MSVHIKTRLLETSEGICHQTSSAHLQATHFLFHVFAAAVVSWGDHVVPLLLGVRATWLPWQPESKPQILEHSLYGEESHVGNALPHCLLGMPLSLAQLLSKEPWSSQRHKVRVCVQKNTFNPRKKEDK